MRNVVILFLVLALTGGAGAFAQESPGGESANEGKAGGSLAEVRDKRNMMLVVSRGHVVDLRDPARAALRALNKESRRRDFSTVLAFNTIAGRLNKYIRKYHSLSSVEQEAEADFFVLFNVLEVRVFTGYAYPYGELLVVRKATPGDPNPRLLWRTRQKPLWAGDAASEFIKAMKAARGEDRR